MSTDQGGLVLDASVALYLVTGVGRSAVVGHRLHAPTLLWSESLSALREQAYRGVIDASVVPEALARLEALEISPHGDADLRRRALAVAETLGWAKTYDAEYVALAELLELPLLTLDERLSRRVADRIRVVGPVDLARGRSSDGDQEGSTR